MTTADRRATVLIIEDDAVLARAFARALVGDGYQVRTAASAEEGLQETGRCRPDAILLDFRMPLINGLGFLYRLRAQEPNRQTPVVVVTGDSLLKDDVKAEFRELGAEVRLKPLGLEDLLATTRALLDGTSSDLPNHSEKQD